MSKHENSLTDILDRSSLFGRNNEISNVCLVAGTRLHVFTGWAVAGSEEVAPASFPAEVQLNLCSEPQEIIQALQLKRKGVNLREAWVLSIL